MILLLLFLALQYSLYYYFSLIISMVHISQSDFDYLLCLQSPLLVFKLLIYHFQISILTLLLLGISKLQILRPYNMTGTKHNFDLLILSNKYSMIYIADGYSTFMVSDVIFHAASSFTLQNDFFLFKSFLSFTYQLAY